MRRAIGLILSLTLIASSGEPLWAAAGKRGPALPPAPPVVPAVPAAVDQLTFPFTAVAPAVPGALPEASAAQPAAAVPAAALTQAVEAAQTLEQPQADQENILNRIFDETSLEGLTYHQDGSPTRGGIIRFRTDVHFIKYMNVDYDIGSSIAFIAQALKAWPEHPEFKVALEDVRLRHRLDTLANQNRPYSDPAVSLFRSFEQALSYEKLVKKKFQEFGDAVLAAKTKREKYGANQKLGEFLAELGPKIDLLDDAWTPALVAEFRGFADKENAKRFAGKATLPERLPNLPQESAIQAPAVSATIENLEKLRKSPEARAVALAPHAKRFIDDGPYGLDSNRGQVAFAVSSVLIGAGALVAGVVFGAQIPSWVPVAAIFMFLTCPFQIIFGGWLWDRMGWSAPQPYWGGLIALWELSGKNIPEYQKLLRETLAGHFGQERNRPYWKRFILNIHLQWGRNVGDLPYAETMTILNEVAEGVMPERKPGLPAQEHAGVARILDSVSRGEFIESMNAVQNSPEARKVALAPLAKKFMFEPYMLLEGVPFFAGALAGILTAAGVTGLLEWAGFSPNALPEWAKLVFVFSVVASPFVGIGISALLTKYRHWAGVGIDWDGWKAMWEMSGKDVSKYQELLRAALDSHFKDKKNRPYLKKFVVEAEKGWAKEAGDLPRRETMEVLRGLLGESIEAGQEAEPGSKLDARTLASRALRITSFIGMVASGVWSLASFANSDMLGYILAPLMTTLFALWYFVSGVEAPQSEAPLTQENSSDLSDDELLRKEFGEENYAKIQEATQADALEKEKSAARPQARKTTK